MKRYSNMQRQSLPGKASATPVCDKIMFSAGNSARTALADFLCMTRQVLLDKSRARGRGTFRRKEMRYCIVAAFVFYASAWLIISEGKAADRGFVYPYQFYYQEYTPEHILPESGIITDIDYEGRMVSIDGQEFRCRWTQFSVPPGARSDLTWFQPGMAVQYKRAYQSITHLALLTSEHPEFSNYFPDTGRENKRVPAGGRSNTIEGSRVSPKNEVYQEDGIYKN
jgi:hypothetical protein